MYRNSISIGLFSLATCILSACEPAPPNATTAAAQNASTEAAMPSETQAVSAAANPRVTEAFGGESFGWQGGGGLLYRYTGIERDGEIYICGAYARRGSTGKNRLSREALRQSTLRANGDSIMRDMSHFKIVSSANLDTFLVGVETNCRSTGLAAGSLDLNSLQITTRRGSYRVRT